MTEAIKKYKIDSLLDAMPFNQRQAAIKELPTLLDVKARTLSNYRAILISEPQDIPHTVVAKLEAFFDIPCGTLRNFEIDMPSFREQYRQTMEVPLTQKFNLTKS